MDSRCFMFIVLQGRWSTSIYIDGYQYLKNQPLLENEFSMKCTLIVPNITFQCETSFKMRHIKHYNGWCRRVNWSVAYHIFQLNYWSALTVQNLITQTQYLLMVTNFTKFSLFIEFGPWLLGWCEKSQVDFSIYTSVQKSCDW